MTGRRTAIVLVVLMSACSRPVSPPPGSAGAVALGLTVGAAPIESVHYQVTGTGIAPIAGTIAVTGPGSTVSVLVEGLPAGTGYEVSLDAVSKDGATTCSGSATFAVLAGKTTAVTVPLSCRTSSARGGVEIDTVVADCPRVTMTSAAPQRAVLGAAISLEAQATGAPPPSAFSWTSADGAFSDPHSSSTRFFCAAEGDRVLTVTAVGEHCSDSATVTVHCEPLGAVGSAAQCLTGGDVLFLAGNDVVQNGAELLRGRWSVHGDSNHVLQLTLVPVNQPKRAWSLSFGGGSSDLRPAIYGGLESPPAPGAPSLTVASDQRACQRTFGNFQIQTLEGDPSSPSSFTATFEQHCEGAAASVQGCVHYEAAPRQSEACLACEQSHVPDVCDARIGCQHLTDPADVQLCQDLDRCMLTTGCWRGDEFNDCLCGTARDTACLVPGAANGVCLAEAMAATRARDIVDAGTRFFDFAFPAGFATQRLGCDRDFCSSDRAGVAGPCGQTSDCPDDGNPCTDEVMAGGVCTHPLAADGTRCNDHDACTQTDACVGGACQGSNPVRCDVPAPASCTSGGACNPASGLCLGGVPRPDGTPCDDSLNCTDGDVCSDGRCQGSARRCSAGQTCVEASGTCQTLDACSTCEQQNALSGLCEPKMGCANVTTGAADLALCQALDGCMRRTRCWTRDPLECLCGSVDQFHCLGGGGNGPCKAETEAATRSTSAEQVLQRFYDFGYPAGFATQRFGCDHDYCPAVCAP